MVRLPSVVVRSRRSTHATATLQVFVEPGSYGRGGVAKVPANAVRLRAAALVAPLVERGHGNAEELGYLVRGEQTFHVQP
jgi:hypothetical protein